ncbi:MAG TPA: hypothetical protein VFB69_03815 [Candidatus Dormibacteraeota bacterium]|nr:hypothetical protein [Candidatus Dormibacteraeota bacterium]
MSAHRLRWAAAACSGFAVVLLVAAIVLNDRSLAAEDFLPSDDAFGAFALAMLLAGVACLLGVRSARTPTSRTATFEIVLVLASTALAVLGGILALSEPAIFNSGYQCFGQSPVHLYAAMRPSPATCGYLIPATDDALFYPSVFATFSAAVLDAAAAALVFAGRMRRST